MRLAIRHLAMPALTLVLAAGSCAFAQPQAAKPATAPQQNEADRAAAGPVRTGKERLGPKWSDEQRFDNCNVPPARQGEKARPGCEGSAK
jgi:hypothetical protein